MANQLTNSFGSNVLLEMEGISKAVPGVQALDDVRLTVRSGKLHALLGENGAGKSTLMNILAGVLLPDEGEIRIAGQPVHFKSARQAQEAGIAMIFQELNLFPGLTVAENVFAGREPINQFGLMDYTTMNGRTRRLLQQLELDIDPRTPVERLPVSAQQVVEIAKALSYDARILIMDEPTSAITRQETEVLFHVIGQLKQRGVGIIYITHKLDELPYIADEVTILRDGRFIDHRPMEQIAHDEIVQLMVGRELADLFPKTPGRRGEEVLKVESISLPHPERAGAFVVKDVSLKVHRGEVVGLFGLMGAGRTELLQTVFGLHPNSASGEVHVAGQKVLIRSPQQAVAAGVALAPEDRKAEGLVLAMSVAENVSLTCLARAEHFGLLSAQRETALVRPYLDRLRVKAASPRQKTGELSGGNQQKVVLAKWLATQPVALLLDEPTRGIDINAKKEIYGLIDDLTRQGLGVLIVSSELPEILAISDRILVLSQGRLTAEFSREDANEQAILEAALPKRIFDESAAA